MSLAVDDFENAEAGRRKRTTGLERFFAPESIALVGASESLHSVGRAVLDNLAPFPGQVHLVNPNHPSIFGKQTFATVAEIPIAPDLTVIATPAKTVPQIIRSCVEAEIPAAVILSAGFKECGKQGLALETEVIAEARKGGMRLIGPNCLGLMIPHLKLNATFANRMADPGSVAFLSQSGALCAAVLDWSVNERTGFSAFVSVGSMIDVGWGDLIDYFGNDPHTKSIVCYMESIDDGRSFMSAAREVALTKPVIILKVGHTEAGAKAAASHTGALTGSDAVLDAAFRRAGVLRVNTLDELLDMAEVLSKQPRLHGPRLTIITNAGGPGALAADMLISNGGKLARLSDGTQQTLNTLLPTYWSHSNPVDILGDADALRYKETLEIVADDPKTDGILTILTPQAVTDPASTAHEICLSAKSFNKPVIASWMGGASVANGEALLNAAHIPTFKTPDNAARTFALMWQYSDNLRALYETPTYSPTSSTKDSARVVAGEIIRTVREQKRTLLLHDEAEQIFRSYGIPVIESLIAKTEDEAVREANAIGYPIAMKLLSKTITHKSDVGGVILDVKRMDEVRSGWRKIRANVARVAHPEDFCGVVLQRMVRTTGIELILGSSVDSQFGPTILFGAGGKFVEIFKDTVIGLPPLNATLAQHLIERTKIATALKGVPGEPPVNNASLEQLLIAFSQLIIEQPLISEIDINPLLATSDGMLALDFRIILHPAEIPISHIPRSAIRPYPSQYIFNFSLKDGTPVTLRPIRAEDEALMAKFHQTLSDRSVYMRYFTPFRIDQRTAHTRLIRGCVIDYDREMALVAEHMAANGLPHIVGIARLSRARHAKDGEFSLLISDEWQQQGLGTELLRRIVEIGRDAELARITGLILEDNCPMQRLAEKCGFTLRHRLGECIAEIDISPLRPNRTTQEVL